VADKPSYFGMLNAIANAERQGYEYLNAWCERATDPNVKATLTVVATRELEHSLAFTKRIHELGFELEPQEVIDFSKQMDIVTSDCSDYEKAEALGLFDRKTDSDERDIFAGLFDDKTIDIQTGALLGRYIAEERDSGRMIAACAKALKARHNGGSAPDRMDSLEQKVDAVCAAVERLTELVSSENTSNGRRKTKAAAAN
jgi:Mn-containing catalase